MITLVVVGMVCGTVLLIGHRLSVLLPAKWEADRNNAFRIAQEMSPSMAHESRRIAVLEREVAIKERLHTAQKPIEPMPVDLHNRITMWEDEFAQELERSTMLTLYNELGDWDKVRSKLAPIPKDTEAAA